MIDKEYEVVPVAHLIPVDELVHTDEHPFCGDMTCPGHEDQGLIEELAQHVQNGQASTGDADRIYRGRTI